MKKNIFMKFKITNVEVIEILLIFLLLVILGIGAFLSIRTSLSENGKLVFASTVPQENTIFKMFSYISGQVKKPGVYEVQDGMKIIDLISLAGGFTDEVDSEFVSKEINLSELLKDEQKIYIPSINESAEGKTTSSQNPMSSVNINSASLEELDSLSGIGPATAQKIIEARPFEKIEDIMNVSGIGESKFNQIKDFITVR